MQRSSGHLCRNFYETANCLNLSREELIATDFQVIKRMSVKNQPVKRFMVVEVIKYELEYNRPPVVAPATAQEQGMTDEARMESYCAAFVDQELVLSVLKTLAKGKAPAFDTNSGKSAGNADTNMTEQAEASGSKKDTEETADK